MGKTTEGKCAYCGGTFSKVSMTKHLQNCIPRRAEHITEAVEKIERYYCISVQGYHSSEYWLYIDVPANTTLKTFDGFLRDIWLECCGHLSQFEIDGQTYSSHADKDYGERSMNTKLGNVLTVGEQFKHEYDFGSTTYLKLKVISEFNGKKRKKKVKLLARNNQPIIECSYCGNPATNVCCQCIYDGDGWLCDACLIPLQKLI